MRKPFWLTLTVALSILPACSQTYRVGVVDRAFLSNDPSYDWRGAKTHALLSVVWYPADSAAVERPQWVGDPAHPFASAGRAAPHAELARTPARFPLILLSHGTGGSAMMMAWLGTQLAAHGFIAVAVNHPGNNGIEPHTVQGFTLGWERSIDLSRVLAGMLADPEFGPRIDPQRVGAAGFSFGGYTVLEIAGGIGDMSPALTECAEPHSTAALCQSPPEFPDLVKRALSLAHTDPAFRRALEASRQPHADPRIRAVFAIAPFATVFTVSSLEKIKIPVAVVAGAGDPILSPKANAAYAAAHIPGAKLTILPGGVGHYTFLDTCTASGKAELPPICVDQPGVDRDAVHAQVAHKATDFFGLHLRR
jgi:predicted dienelactone hydrolase